MNPIVLRDLVTDLLDAAVDALTPDPMNEDDPRTTPPARRFTAHAPGVFAWDCELVAASLTGLTLDTTRTGGGSGGCTAVPVATLVVTILRCWPTIDGDGIPPAEEITEATDRLNVDAAALTDGLLAGWSAGTLFPGIGCGRIELGPLDPIGPAGGYAGWRYTATVRF